MAILNAENESPSAAPCLSQPSARAALFLRTLVPRGATSRAISCSLLPLHPETRSQPRSPQSLHSARQLVTVHANIITVYAVHDATLSLRTLTSVQLSTQVRDIVAVPTPAPGRDVLVVLSEKNRVSFMQYDDQASLLRAAGDVQLPSSEIKRLRDKSPRGHARLLAKHPRRRLVAVAAVESTISVFPLLFLPQSVSAGKIATVSVEGVIVSLDFLEDNGDASGDAILVSLLQTAKEQIVSLYTVGVRPDLGGGLSVTHIGDMITCVSHPSERAIARATSKFTRSLVEPFPLAASITALTGCPYLFAVFADGKVIAGDARSLLVDASIGEQASMSVRVVDGSSCREGFVSGPGQIESTEHGEYFDASEGFPVFNPQGSLSNPYQHQSSPHSRRENINRREMHATAHGVYGPSLGGRNRGGSTEQHFSSSRSSHGTNTYAPLPAGNSSGNPGTGQGSGGSSNYGRNPSILPFRRMCRTSNDTPQLSGLSPHTQSNIHSGRRPNEHQVRASGEEYLSYVFVPNYIAFDIGDYNGVATTWVHAQDHFCDESGDGGGLYFVTENGAMFVLRWTQKLRSGATAFKIPGGQSTGVSLVPSFNVEYIGDVGPAICIAALDCRLIFIANHSADGSLRKLHLPHNLRSSTSPVCSSWTSRDRTLYDAYYQNLAQYGLEVRQEFLNCAPVSDFVIAPPVKLNLDADEKSALFDSEERNACFDGRRSDDRPAKDSSLGGLGMKDDTHGTASRSQQFRCDDRHGTDDDEGERVCLTCGMQNEKGNTLCRYPIVDRRRTAANHVAHGAQDENELIVCSGMGRHGTIRFMRPGAPVSLFASSAPDFPACNDMWPIRFSTSASHQAGVLMTFAESSGILYSLPVASVRSENSDELPPIAKLTDGSQASGIITSCRTIAIGTLEDGVLAQMHANGIRIIHLRKAEDFYLKSSSSGVLSEPLFARTADWTPPGNGYISVGTIGAGYALACVMQRGPAKPLLCLLKMHVGERGANIIIVASATLQKELSCISIPEWSNSTDNSNVKNSCFPLVAILGTYAPSVEIRLLSPKLELVEDQHTFPWSLTISRAPFVSGSDGGEYERFSGAASVAMTAVPESLSGLNVNGSRLVFAGLRDGSVIIYTLGDICPRIGSIESPSGLGSTMQVKSHRKLGHRPVVLKKVKLAVGDAILGQSERPWICVHTDSGTARWNPLAFAETTALCAYSVPGADHCFTAISVDGALHICGVRRISEVSVRSICVGATPRRVLALEHPENCIIVATSTVEFCTKYLNQDAYSAAGSNAATEKIEAKEIMSSLRIFDRRLGLECGNLDLLPGENVHVLISWLRFIVVGTSVEAQSNQQPGMHGACKYGRLLLYSVQSQNSRSHDDQWMVGGLKLLLCSEVVLPGAVLCGTAHPTENILVISCNEDVIVFGTPKSQSAFVEIARTTTRSLVVSLSVFDDVICVGDKKDSIGFYTLGPGVGKLTRDRSDYRKRTVSDAIVVDRTLSIGVDRTGALFSVGYEKGDAPRASPIRWPSILSVHKIPARGDKGQGETEVADDVRIYSGEPGLSSEALGEEFDLMLADSDSENANESLSQGADFGDNPTEDVPDVLQNSSEDADQVVAHDSNQSHGGSGSGEIQNASATSGMDDVHDGGTNTPNQTQTDDDNFSNEQPTVPAITNALANIMNDGTTGANTTRNEGIPVPRNLECHHTFNLNDASLRIRLGNFNRSEKAGELEDQKNAEKAGSGGESDNFFQRPSQAIFCGTMGGSIIAGVPIATPIYELLRRVEAELGVNLDIAGSHLGISHHKFRSAYGMQAKGAVDGDLLNHFEHLSRPLKLGIANRIGFAGERGVLHIEAVIRDLFDRVA